MQHALPFYPMIEGGTSGLGEQTGPPAFGRYSGGVNDTSVATLSGTDVLGAQSAMGTTLDYSGPVSTLTKDDMPFENSLLVRVYIGMNERGEIPLILRIAGFRFIPKRADVMVEIVRAGDFNFQARAALVPPTLARVSTEMRHIETFESSKGFRIDLGALDTEKGREMVSYALNQMRLGALPGITRRVSLMAFLFPSTYHLDHTHYNSESLALSDYMNPMIANWGIGNGLASGYGAMKLAILGARVSQLHTFKFEASIVPPGCLAAIQTGNTRMIDYDKAGPEGQQRYNKGGSRTVRLQNMLWGEDESAIVQSEDGEGYSAISVHPASYSEFIPHLIPATARTWRGASDNEASIGVFDCEKDDYIRITQRDILKAYGPDSFDAAIEGGALGNTVPKNHRHDFDELLSGDNYGFEPPHVSGVVSYLYEILYLPKHQRVSFVDWVRQKEAEPEVERREQEERFLWESFEGFQPSERPTQSVEEEQAQQGVEGEEQPQQGLEGLSSTRGVVQSSSGVEKETLNGFSNLLWKITNKFVPIVLREHESNYLIYYIMVNLSSGDKAVEAVKATFDGKIDDEKVDATIAMILNGSNPPSWYINSVQQFNSAWEHYDGSRLSPLLSYSTLMQALNNGLVVPVQAIWFRPNVLWEMGDTLMCTMSNFIFSYYTGVKIFPGIDPNTLTQMWHATVESGAAVIDPRRGINFANTWWGRYIDGGATRILHAGTGADGIFSNSGANKRDMFPILIPHHVDYKEIPHVLAFKKVEEHDLPLYGHPNVDSAMPKWMHRGYDIAEDAFRITEALERNKLPAMIYQNTITTEPNEQAQRRNVLCPMACHVVYSYEKNALGVLRGGFSASGVQYPGIMKTRGFAAMQDVQEIHAGKFMNVP